MFILENCQGWNVVDVEVGGQLLFFFGIEFGQLGIGFEIDGGLMEIWCYYLVWVVLLCLEIDDDWQVVVFDVVIEICSVQFQWFVIEERVFVLFVSWVLV